MVKICPSCRHPVSDDTALFCNKCGYPFPKNRPAGAGVAAARARRPAPSPSRRIQKRPSGISGFFSFETLFTAKYLKPIYLTGAVLIILVSVMGVAGMFAKPVKNTKGAANESFINTTAIAQDPAGSSLFWIGFLVAGSILWRMFCELFVLISRRYGPADYAPGAGPEDEPEEYGEEEDAGYGGEEEPQYIECPKCAKLVTIDQLRVCERCGVEGCSGCIRAMGLLKKSMTCRECFEGE